MLRRQMEETARQAGLDPPPLKSAAAPAGGASAEGGEASAGERGPGAADMAAAAGMSPEDRQKMIRGMVDGLAARLEKNPDDSAGWLRLARAYGVLGENAKAAEAAGRAATLQPGNVDALLAQARALIERDAPAETAGAPGQPPTVSPEAVAVLERVAALDPKQPEALWFLGLAKAQQHDPKGAADYWQRLLGQLSPGSEDYKMVEAALAALEHKG
jgi:cytochrome c-type biogenesis protein CcmH